MEEKTIIKGQLKGTSLLAVSMALPVLGILVPSYKIIGLRLITLPITATGILANL